MALPRGGLQKGCAQSRQLRQVRFAYSLYEQWRLMAAAGDAECELVRILSALHSLAL